MEQKHVSPEKKDSILKSLAIAGFIAIIVILAWLGVQLVQLLPNAMTSLASLAEGVNNYQQSIVDNDIDASPLVVTSDTSLLNTGEEITITWSDVNATGNYVFTYECIDGVGVTEVSAQGQRELNCDTNYDIGDTNQITLAITSDENRYADVPYTIAFLRSGDTEPRTTGGNVLTVANQDIDSQFAVAPDNGELSGEETVTPAPTEPSPETPAPTPEPVTVIEEYIYEIPVSDPNGFTDLSALYIGVGEIIDGAFVEGPLSVDNAGAIQFSVRNIGTKTSDDWTFSVVLPNGDTYESSTQTELKPNERSVLTIGFAAGGDTPHTFVVDTDESGDTRNDNNGFARTVTLAN